MKMKIIDFVDNGIDAILLTFLFFLLLIGCYITYDTAYVYNNASAGRLASYKPEIINEETLKEISENVTAWLIMNDTQIDYPVMQGHDNNEYLNKDPFGDYSLSGSIFLDSRNEPDYSDEYNVLYGHHMSGGFMFGALDYYENEKYFMEHRTGSLIVGNTTYPLTAIAFLRCPATKYEIFSPTTEYDRTAFIKERASILAEEPDGKMMALTTCVNTETMDRTVVIVKLGEGVPSDVESTAQPVD